MTRTAMQYQEILNDLFEAIANYRKEYETPIPDPDMRRIRRQALFIFYDELHDLGNPKRKSWTLKGVHLDFKEPVSIIEAQMIADQVKKTHGL